MTASDEKLTDNKPTRRVGDGTPGPGRPKGVPNKTTIKLKEAILAAAEQHGRDGQGEQGLQGYLFKLASEESRAFAQLLGRVLPLDLSSSDGTMTPKGIPDDVRSALDAIAGKLSGGDGAG
jgi:hypothetical protein